MYIYVYIYIELELCSSHRGEAAALRMLGAENWTPTAREAAEAKLITEVL